MKQSTISQPDRERSKGIWLILAVIGIIVLVAVSMGAGAYLTDGARGATHYQNTFVDFNGDGLTDYVISADIIINNGTLNLSQSQP